MGKRIKVLVVDDSSIMRLLISDVLNEYSDIEVINTAKNGKEALECVLSDQPHVVVMDMNMGEYSGLYGVDTIMSKKPTPVIMLSAVGNTNMSPIIEAMQKGAFDYLNKPEKNNTKIRDIKDQLAEKVRAAANCDTSKLLERSAKAVTHAHSFQQSIPYDIIAIGSSTGGPSAVESIVSRFPENLPLPVVIAQHMPQNFIASFAERLNTQAALTVQVAKMGVALKPQNVYIMQGEKNTILRRNEAGQVIISSTSKRFKEFNDPSINALFHSVAEIYRERAIGVILTGMGKDGAEGMLSIKTNGGYTVAQDEKTSVVFGMPKEAIKTGAVDSIVSIKDMGMFLMSCLS